jgi:hypothetical protein
MCQGVWVDRHDVASSSVLTAMCGKMVDPVGFGICSAQQRTMNMLKGKSHVGAKLPQRRACGLYAGSSDTIWNLRVDILCHCDDVLVVAPDAEIELGQADPAVLRAPVNRSDCIKFFRCGVVVVGPTDSRV